MCLWLCVNIYCFAQFETVEHSSFVCRLNGHRAQHSHNFRRPRGTSASAPWSAGSPQWPRLDAAAPGGGQRPRRRCRAPFVERRRGGRQGEQGPGASIREACASHRVSNLGHFKIFFRAWRNRVSPTWGTSRIFLGWKFCVAALLAENWWSSYSLFDFLDDIAFERLFDLWTKTMIL